MCKWMPVSVGWTKQAAAGGIAGIVVLGGLFGGCGQISSSSLVWFEATADSNGTIISQGPGRPLVLGCANAGNGAPCRWTGRMLLRSTQPLTSWSFSLLGESGQALVRVTAFNYEAGGFATHAGGEVFGNEPDLLVGVGGSTSDANGVPSGNHVLLHFSLEYANPANGPAERTILGAIGEGGWTEPTDPGDEVPPLIQFAGNLPAPAIGGAVLPEPVIIIDLRPGSNDGDGNVRPENCADGIDNDMDGRVDCDDSDCRNHSACRPKVHCPPDLSLECDGSGNQAAVAGWLESATADSRCEQIEITHDFDGILTTCGASGTAVVRWTVEDTCGEDSCSARLSIVDTTPPTLSVPADFVFSCDETGTQSELRDWLRSAAGADACGEVSLSFSRKATTFNCSGEIAWTAMDACGNESTDSSLLSIEGDTDPPSMVLNGAAAMTLECGVDEYVEPGASVADDCDATLIAPAIAGSVDAHRTGVYVLSYAAIDLCGHAAPSLTRTVTVVDTQAPRVELKAVSLWPPNHEYVALHLSDCARLVDDCEGDLDIDAVGRILEVSSDEPDNGIGDGNTSNDIVVVSDSSFRARAERQGGGDGRTYTIRFEARDSAGHRVESSCFVEVPHDQGG